MLLLQLEPLSRPVAISEMLILLGAAALAGWLLARLILSNHTSGLRQSIAERQSQLEECHRRREVPAPVGVAASVVSTYSPPAVISLPDPATTTRVAAVSTIQSEADNLKLIEGIGPKIEELLNADGIRTFAKLAATSPPHIATLLAAAGARFQIHDPATWPEQAALARDGKWDELKSLHERLTGGRD